MADGGHPERFCSASRAHMPACEYFADGGVVGDFDSLVDDAQDAPAPAPNPQAPVMFDDMKEDAAPDPSAPMQFDALKEDAPAKDYGTTGQQILAGIEGAAQGVAGPVAPFVEHNLMGEPYEAIEGRAEANPWTHGVAQTGAMAASMMAGVGIPGRIAQGTEAAVNALRLGKVGAGIMKGAITNGIFQATDEVSRWLMDEGDPSDAAGAVLANVGASSLLGGVFGGLGPAAGKQLTKLADTKLGERMEFFLHGLAAAAESTTPKARQAMNAGTKGLSEAAERGFKAGQKAFDAITGKLLPGTLGASAEGYAGYKENGLIGGAKGAAEGALHGIIAGLVGKGLGATYGKVAAPTAAWVLAHGGHGVLEALDHAAKTAAGSETLAKGVDSLFKAGTVSGLSSFGSPANRKKVSDYLENGGIDQSVMEEHRNHTPAEGYAEGGPVKAANGDDASSHDAVARLYPQQNMMIQAAKGRMMNYLNTMRPTKHEAKLAFDKDPDTRTQRKAYNRALDIANAPLGILKEVQRGTLTPDDVRHFTALHPEVNGLLQKKLAERITKAQVSGKKPSYRVRQSLSLLMGTPLSGEMTPANIQAAQAVFAAKQPPAPNQQSSAPKGSTSKLSKSSQAYLSDDQARMKRQQRV